MKTAEEFLNSKNYWHSEEYEPLLIEFAKLHVKAALEQASNQLFKDYDNDLELVKAVENCYSESNIK